MVEELGRRAVVDHSRPDKGPDVQRGLILLSALPHARPGTEGAEQVAEQIERGWTFRSGDALVRLDPQPDNRWVEIVWWLPLSSWLGEGMDALIKAFEAVVEAYGLRARQWGTGGLFLAPGDTPGELRRNSEAIARIHLQWCPTMEVYPDPLTNYWRAKDTIQNALNAARAWRELPRG